MIHRFAVILGLGCWLGSVAGLVAPYIRPTPEFLHWFPLGACAIGMVAGCFIANKIGAQS